jgi:hypothetical protein
VLLLTCNGRGSRLLAQPNHDTGLVSKIAGEVLYRGLSVLESSARRVGRTSSTALRLRSLPCRFLTERHLLLGHPLPVRRESR